MRHTLKQMAVAGVTVAGIAASAVIVWTVKGLLTAFDAVWDDDEPLVTPR